LFTPLPSCSEADLSNGDTKKIVDNIFKSDFIAILRTNITLILVGY
jgi:hypothetical protein